MQLTPEKFTLLQTALLPHAAVEDTDSFFERESEMSQVRDALTDA
jgi:hypothetical protein